MQTENNNIELAREAAEEQYKILLDNGATLSVMDTELMAEAMNQVFNEEELKLLVEQYKHPLHRTIHKKMLELGSVYWEKKLSKEIAETTENTAAPV